MFYLRLLGGITRGALFSQR